MTNSGWDRPLPVFPGLRELAERRRRGVIEELVAARREQGLSQTVIAARMETSQSVVARLESGDVDVRLSTLERYAAAVGRQVDLRVGPAGGRSA
jgi:transcriptional regulator with XRE-family HTH domain